jgi:predicted AlkP superfamily phosphohydrolase/phosphomutase
LSQLHLTVKSRKNALDLLWPDLAWDLFVHVFTETDRLFHFFMDAVLDRTHSDHLPCMQFLAEWDNSIGNFLKRYDALPSPKRLIVIADHGFTQIKTEVCINTWLKQNGYLNMTHKPSNEWDATVISEDTTAFALDPGRIYIHTTKQFNRGTVSSDQYPVLLKEIKQKLLKLEFNGERVLEQVHSRETLYPGANFPNTPDLICQPKPGFDLKAKFDRKAIFGLHGRHGTHTVDGAIFYDSQKTTPSKMHEVGKIILDHFNI